MALSDRVTERYSTGFLVQLTNPDDETATTINTTLLGYAATDAQADFLTYASVAYDETQAQHVAVAVEGVIAYLKKRGAAGGPKADADLDKFREALGALAKTGARKRVTPATDSQLTPTDEFAGKDTVRPDFDRRRFDDLVPGEPSAEDTENA